MVTGVGVDTMSRALGWVCLYAHGNTGDSDLVIEGHKFLCEDDFGRLKPRTFAN